MAPDSQLLIAGHNFTIAGQTLLPSGKRSFIRRVRPSQGAETFPTTAIWPLSGPLGQSREGANGELGHDWGTLEARFDGLLTSLGQVSTTDASANDPPLGGLSAMLGFMLGTRVLGGGTALSAPGLITHIKEAAGQLFLGRGGFVTQVDPSTNAVVETTPLGAGVQGMEMWFQKLRIGLGGTKAIQTVTGVSATGANYSDTQVASADTYGKEMVAGNDRLWFVRADPAGTDENRLRYTLDDFVSQSTGFVVGDPGYAATGVGRMGPTTVAGSQIGVFGFTSEGIPFNLLDALRDAVSPDNGRQFATQFGWTYTITSLGLFALRAQVANPVGIGSESMWGFEGFDGVPVAVLAWRESLFVAYEDSAGTTWRILRGVFNPGFTEATGELDWYPFAQRTTAAIRRIAATSTPAQPTIVWGEGADTLARMPQGRGGKDILDAAYRYLTSGGFWHGSRMMRRQHTAKNVRWGRFFTEQVTSGDSWTLAVSMEDGGTYTDVGTATANGSQKVAPATLTSAPTGHTIKPRLTQVAGGADSASSPPQLRGVLEIGYDERPEMVTELSVVIAPLTAVEYALLVSYADGSASAGRQPVQVGLPGSSVEHFGYVMEVEEQDVDKGSVMGAAVRLVLMDAA